MLKQHFPRHPGFVGEFHHNSPRESFQSSVNDESESLSGQGPGFVSEIKISPEEKSPGDAKHSPSSMHKKTTKEDEVVKSCCCGLWKMKNKKRSTIEVQVDNLDDLREPARFAWK